MKGGEAEETVHDVGVSEADARELVLPDAFEVEVLGHDVHPRRHEVVHEFQIEYGSLAGKSRIAVD